MLEAERSTVVFRGRHDEMEEAALDEQFSRGEQETPTAVAHESAPTADMFKTAEQLAIASDT